MEREIKFRYRLRLNEGEHVEFKKGDIGTFYFNLNDIQNGLARFSIEKKWDIVSFDEFTGLKDKDGKEIYEGDILLWDTDTTLKVVFKDGEYKGIQIDGPVPGNLHCYHFSSSIIIGNIHENKDLLTPIT